MGEGRHEWTRPGAHEVAAGVYRIPLPLPNDGLRAVNVYAIVEDGALTLIDGGWARDEARRALADALHDIGAGLGDIRRFLVTHVHRDHYTQAVALRREFGSTVLLGEGERATVRRLTDPGHVPLARQLDLLDMCGAKPVRDALLALYDEAPHFQPWEEPDEWITAEADLGVAGRSLRAVSTPGHTTGHMVFVDDANAMMFAGDHVLPHITPSLGLEQAPSESPLRDYLASLRHVRALPDMWLLPAHGPVTSSVHQRVDELLEHHDERLHATAVGLRSGANTAYEVARQLTWTRREHGLDELDPFNQMLAVLETHAHLDVLLLQQRVHRELVDGVHQHAPV